MGQAVSSHHCSTQPILCLYYSFIVGELTHSIWNTDQYNELGHKKWLYKVINANKILKSSYNLIITTIPNWIPINDNGKLEVFRRKRGIYILGVVFDSDQLYKTLVPRAINVLFWRAQSLQRSSFSTNSSDFRYESNGIFVLGMVFFFFRQISTF